MTDSKLIRGVISWSEGIDTELAYSRVLEDGTERQIESIELDGVRWIRAPRKDRECEWMNEL